MAISAVVAVGAAGDQLVSLLKQKGRSDQDRPGRQGRRRHGAARHRRAPQQGPGFRRTRARPKARKSWSTAARSGMKEGFFLGTTLFDHVKPEMEVYKNEIFGPVLVVLRVKTLEEAIALVNSQSLRQRHGDLHRVGRRGAPLPERDPGRHGRHQRADPGAGRVLLVRRLEELAVRRPARARHGRRSSSTRAPRSSPRAGRTRTRRRPASTCLLWDDDENTCFRYSLCSSPAQVIAQEYPTKTIKIVIPLTPGSGADIAGRIIAARMSEHWKQPVIIENRPGAGGQIGTSAVIKSEPDGYTLLVQSSSHAANPAIYKSLPYDPLKDTVDVAILGKTPYVMVTAASGPYKDLKSADRSGEEAAGRAPVRVRRHRHLDAPRGRVRDRHGRAEDDPRAVQGLARRDPGRARRPQHLLHGADQRRHEPGEGRQAHRPRRLDPHARRGARRTCRRSTSRGCAATT